MSGPDTSMLYQRTIPVPEGISVEVLLQKWNPGVEDQVLEGMVSSILRWNQLTSLDQIRPNQEVTIPTIVPPGMTPRQWRESQPDRPKRKPFQVGSSKFDAPPDPAASVASSLAPAPSTPRPGTGRMPVMASTPGSGGTGRMPAMGPARSGTDRMPAMGAPRSGTDRMPAMGAARSGTDRMPAMGAPRSGTDRMPAMGASSTPDRGTGRMPVPQALGQGLARPQLAGTHATAAMIEMKARQATTGPWQASNPTGQVMGGSDVKEQFQKMMQQEIWKKRQMKRPF